MKIYASHNGREVEKKIDILDILTMLQRQTFTLSRSRSYLSAEEKKLIETCLNICERHLYDAYTALDTAYETIFKGRPEL